MKKKLLAALSLFALAMPAARGASDYLLELDGIKGESKDERHKDSIEILSWSVGASNPTAGTGGGGGAGKVVFQDMHFTTSVSKASPKLFLACATGQHIKKAVLYGRKSGGDQQEYYTITLEDVIVSSWSTSASDGSGIPAAAAPGAATVSAPPTDTVTIKFAKATISYLAPDGTTITGSAGAVVNPVSPQ